MTEPLATWKFYRWSRDTWEGMIDVLESAKKAIDFEQYYFTDIDDGLIGHRFIEIFERKAKQGVKVRILLDATGSFEMYRSKAVENLRKAGAEVLFHKLLPLRHASRFFQSFLRDHRRLIVVDDSVAMIGGTAIKEAADNWRDTHVQIEGPVVEHFVGAFKAVWYGMQDRKHFKVTLPIASPDKFTVLPNGILPRQRFIPHTILDGIRDAKKSIFITTPYFAPDHSIFRALILAAGRGVDVRLLLPALNDSKFAKLVAESFFAGAFRAGIRVYLYTPSFLHSKTVIIDDDWGTVGSCNFDQLSFHLNYELNLLSYDAKFVLELKNHFFDDLQSSVEVLPDEWRKRSIFQKLLEKFSVITRPFV